MITVDVNSVPVEKQGNNKDVVTYTFITYIDESGKIKIDKFGDLIVEDFDESSPDYCWDTFAVWNSIPVKYYIDPDNTEGLSDSFVINAINAAAEAWDDETSIDLFDDNYEVIHDGVWNVKDGKNVIVFGKYRGRGASRVIAATRYWVVSGIYEEFDILFNEKMAWGDASTNPSVYDLQGIATHELGHGVGLLDIYSSECYWATMYGYGSKGLTYQRTLDVGDIIGLQYLYGI